MLIVGASGGVGSVAVQIAKAFGAEITGVCSTAKVDAVRAIGADHVIDYTIDDFADGTHRYDAILDIGGNRRLSHLRRALSLRGNPVIVGGETDEQLRPWLSARAELPVGALFCIVDGGPRGRAAEHHPAPAPAMRISARRRSTCKGSTLRRSSSRCTCAGHQ